MLIDRDVEVRCTAQLNSRNFGARMLATFENGRIESYLEGVTLTPDDVRRTELIPRIAARLAEFHACRVSVPQRAPQLWETLVKWWELA
jgi:thiamine kinase-like enzyme